MSSIESLFAKNKKKKKANRNLELDDAAPKSRSSVDTTLTGEGSILGGDGGWVNDVEKKKVVYTEGKKVAELINMNELMTADEAAAERVYQQEQRREFTESRAAKEMQEEGKHVSGEDETSKAEPKESGERGLGSFGGLKWRDRMAQKELNKRMAQLDVKNMEAFPSLGGALPAETTQAHASSVWVGGTAATTAKHDDPNDVGNQNSIVDKDEVIDNGLPHEDKGAYVVKSETAPEPDVVQSETAPGPVDEPIPTVAKTLTPDGGTIEEQQQLSSLDLLVKANKKIKKKKKKDAGKDDPQPPP